jgi:hypothetical protein
MAKAKEPVAEPKFEIMRAPSVLPLLHGIGGERDEMAMAFAEASAGQEQTKESILPILRIDHKKESFTLQGQPYGDAVEGYLLHYVQQRAWWERPFREGNPIQPPDCASADMTRPNSGVPKPQAELCCTCPKQEFGSGVNGTSQACGVSTFFFLLNPNDFPPHGIAMLQFPPTSIKSMLGTKRGGGGYIGSAKAFRAPGGKPAEFYQIIYGRFTLERGGDNYCVLKGEPVSKPESREEVIAISELRNKFLEVFRRMQTPMEQQAD